ncbi:kallikrein-10 isoform X1 [Lemur catta]|uniref:kallikrein-10 isoform X1 n=1 Tax=Lemur catta TaxID=9447 RepID=UPI001E26C2B1|nr:kallikrein-10 isoform X1 [Lemur catta]
MRPPHRHLSAASGAWALAKLLPLLLMAQLCAAEAVLLPGNDTGSDPVASGAPCPRGSQPWQVSLFNGLSFHCAGVLVDQNWVLTAAHCWNNKPLWARVGDDHLLLLQGEQLRRAVHAVIHPKYRQGSGPILPGRTDEHDLMLLKLARSAVLGPRVQTLQLPYRCAQPGDQCQVAGWGTTATRRVKYNRGLTCSGVTLLSPKECEVFYPGVVTNNMICAGLDQGQDPCQDPPGHPLMGSLPLRICPASGRLHPDLQIQHLDQENHTLQLIQTARDPFTGSPPPHPAVLGPLPPSTPVNTSPLPSFPSSFPFSVHTEANAQRKW